jgi:hypothetical protein
MRREDWILLHQAACRIVGFICLLEQVLAMTFDTAKKVLARNLAIADSKNLLARSFSERTRRPILGLLACCDFAM